MGEVEFEWKIPKWSNAIERDRARTYFQAYAAACALYFAERAMEELHAGRTRTWTDFKVPDEAIGCGFHEAVRGVLSHHVVIRDGKIANYHPYPPTPWNANPRDVYGTPGPYEDAVQNTPIFEENGPDKFKGIDIMRTVRSFDPCLPCGVHMYLGNGQAARREAQPDVRRFAMNRGPRRRRVPAAAYPEAMMTEPLDAREFQSRLQRLDVLLREVEESADPASAARTREIVQAVLDLHGTGLERILGHLEQAGEAGARVLEACAGDDVVSGLLLLHGLHPLGLETRLLRALEQVRPALRSHGGNVELLDVRDGVVHLGSRGTATAAPRPPRP